ncbi:MAG: urea ABC transporter permease subunit UrtB, partial [Pseudomonadota bacterium]
MDAILSEHSEIIQKGSRRTIQPAIDALAASGSPEAARFMELWQAKEIWVRKEDGAFFLAETDDKKTYRLIDVVTGDQVGEAARKEVKNIKPNSGVRGLIGAALVRFQLSDPDPDRRRAALEAIQRDPAADQLAPLRAAVEGESDPELLALKERLVTLLTIRFDETASARIAAIESVSSDLGLDVRAALNPILATKTVVTGGLAPAGNVARRLIPGEDIPREEALALLADADLAPKLISEADKKAALAAHIDGGFVAGTPVALFSEATARDIAYSALAKQGLAPPAPTPAALDSALASAGIFEVYVEPNEAVTDAAATALSSIETRVQGFTFLDLTLDGLSLASIYFLAAIGLAVTFGVMGVINMAHGEFIMMGAYTGYVVQLFIP